MKCIHVCQHMRQLYGPAIADPIADAVILFIGAFMKSSSWHWREAAVMTFGSTLNGPGSSILTHLVNVQLYRRYGGYVVCSLSPSSQM
ncbi:hypothetical protein EDD16DRAFT_1674413 [Pisolithus croceorrhizus]|nr:hypothetical protein EDD16DRAFT_1674413 [Pisolithus croceorrhizus]KAI6107168.1 hypothetical protein EV401DRAFT_2004336 [Pisolithus croceorrhizus]